MRKKKKEQKTQKDREKPEDHRDLKLFFKDIGIAGIAEIAVGIISILLIPLITKTLGAHDYGLWQQVMVSIGVLCPIAAFGLNNALVRFLPAKKRVKDKQQMIYTILVVELIICFIILIPMLYFSDFLAFYFFDNATAIVMLTGFIFLVHEVNFFCQFYFRALRKIKIFSLFKIIDRYSKFVIIYYFLIRGEGIYEILLVYLGVEIVLTIISLAIIMYNEGISLPNFSQLNSWIRYGLPLVPMGVSSWVIMFSDRYIISFFLPFKQVGIYSAAYNVGFMIMYMITLIDFVLLPTVSKMYDEKQHERIKKLLQLVLTFIIIIIIPYSIGLSVLSKQILFYFSTSTIAQEGWNIIPIITISSLSYASIIVYDKILRLVKKTGIIGAAISVGAVANVVLNIFLIPQIGIIGAAYATLITYLVSAGIIMVYSRKYIQFKTNRSTIIKCIIGSVIMGSVAYVWDPQTLASLILCILSCMIMYGAILIGTKALSKQDIHIFLHMTHLKK